MSQADRQTFIDDVSVFSVGPTDFVARISDASYADEVAVIENGALKDAAAWPMPGKRSVKVDFDEAKEGAVALVPGTVYTVVITETGESKSGNALLVSRSQKYAENLTRSFQFQFQGIPA